MMAGLFLLLFTVYLVTCCPGVSVDDSGEFILAALELGVPHPPGYPLYTLLLALWKWIPVGSVALRLNLASATMAAFAACLIFALWKRTVASHQWIGWVGAGLGALSVGWWSQAGTVKGGVYELNLCLILAVAISFTGIARHGKLVLLGTLGMGLGLANHWMSVLGLIPGLIWMLVFSDRIGIWRRAVLAGVFVVLGVSLYLCLPLHAVRKPFLNWGTPDRLSRLSFVVARRQYFGPASDVRQPLVGRLKEMNLALDGAAPWWLLLSGATLGFVWLLRNAPVGAVPILFFLGVFYGSLLCYGPLLPGRPWYIEIFSIPGTALLFWAATIGVSALARRIPHQLGTWIVLALAGCLAFATIPERWKKCDRSREYLASDLALNLNAHTPKRNLVFAEGDAVIFSSWYVWLTGMRSEGAIVVPSPALPMPWVAESFVRKVQHLHAPYPRPRAGAESIPTLMRGWVEANRAMFAAYTFMTELAREAFGRDSMTEFGLLYRVALNERKQRRPAGNRPPPLARLRYRGLFGEALRRLPQRRLAIQPIYFTGLLAQGSAAARPGVAPSRQAVADARAALTMAGRLAESSSDRAAVALARGNLAVSQREHAEGLRLFREAYDWAVRATEEKTLPRGGRRELDPSLSIALRNLAMVHLSQRRSEEALKFIKMLLAQSPDSEEAQELAPIAAQLERVGTPDRP